jgi:RNA polymerase sigma factor (sigma-70 family)
MLDRLEPSAVVVAHRNWIEKVARITCLKNSVWGEDAEDFASSTIARLIENDYAAVRRFRGECDIKTYLATLVVRGFQEYARSHWGRWRHSARAEQLGHPAKDLEALVYRDGCSLDQAIQVLRSSGKTAATAGELTRIFGELPIRTPHAQSVGDAPLESLADPESTDGRIIAFELRERCREVMEVLMKALGRLDPEEQVLVRGRFGEGRSVADLARALRQAQMPLYRRTERLLKQLRGSMEEAGVSSEDVRDCVALDDPERPDAEDRPETSL